MTFTMLIGCFVWVCDIIIVTEDFFHRPEALSKPYNIGENLGVGVKPPGKLLLLTLVGKCKLDKLDDFVLS